MVLSKGTGLVQIQTVGEHQIDGGCTDERWFLLGSKHLHYGLHVVGCVVVVVVHMYQNVPGGQCLDEVAFATDRDFVWQVHVSDAV